MSAKAAETPMMSQYNRFKKKYADAILLFRVGDFYETFSDDAVEVAALTGITLTKRGNGGANDVPLAGFPYHALDTYLPKLVSKGKRVAICDQVEDPKLTNKLVKRDVTELVTPGLTMHDTVLDANTNNFLAAAVLQGGIAGAAFLDLSTGEFLTTQGRVAEVEKMMNNFDPSETLIKRGSEVAVAERLGESLNLYPLDDWVFSEDYGRDRLLKHFGVKHLKGFGIEEDKLAIIACGAILYYLEVTKHAHLSHINTIRKVEESRFVQLDRFTLHNLEILRPMSEEGVALVQVLDRTHTPMGGRLMKRWLVFPLLDVAEIQKRQRVVTAFFKNSDLSHKVGDLLEGIGDLERLSSKVAVNRINPRELLQVANGLRLAQPIMEALLGSEDKELRELALGIDPMDELAERIEATINPEAPIQAGRGNVIRSGVDKRLDELRSIAGGGKEYLVEMRQRESERTGIPSLKIAFNNVFGYYIEVRNTYKDKVPPEWTRKQTLVSAERYITAELKEYEQKILGAEERIAILEQELYARLMEHVLTYIRILQKNAATLSEIDVLQSFAEVARKNNYAAPTVDDSRSLKITGGRHPVIEQTLPPGEVYIANDLYLDTETQQIIIITGPNMSGKSALLRQTALIVLMAQVGSFVPAESAQVGVVDRIFTRVGASDNISRGESTFMVEMTESAAILNNLTGRSLILIDELGRGTSTYDGISIARAIVEYLHEHPHGHAKTLFATHYHELNELEGVFPRVKNFNVAVNESDGKVVFLRKLIPGGSEHSFGIHVAKMAGMPQPIVDRAAQLLEQLEESASAMRAGVGGTSAEGAPMPIPTGMSSGPVQLSFFQLDDPTLASVRDEIVGIDINALTPIEALNKLDQIQKLLTQK